MVKTILMAVLAYFVVGNCLVLKEKTPNVVRVREGETLTLEAQVDSHELNLRFTDPGKKPIGFGYHDSRARDGYEVLGRTDTGYLFNVWLTIEHIDRYQSGSYFLTGYDAYSWERCNWTVVVQVVPLRHVSVATSPTCDVNDEDGEPGCGRYTAGHDVYWEYMGCNVTVRGAGGTIVSEFDQCEELHGVAAEERSQLLHDAAKYGDERQVAMLSMLGADVNDDHFTWGYNREPVLCLAARFGHVQVTQLLLNSGANLRFEYTLFYAIDFSSPYEVLPTRNVTALDCAARSGSVALVEMILAQETELRAKNVPVSREGVSSFLYAILSGSLTLVKQYLSWGSDWNHRDREGRSPVLYAALTGSVELVEFFHALGADLLSKDSQNRSILFYAARSGSAELVEHLVSAGLQPSENNSGDEELIVEAVIGGSVPVLETFLEWGGNVTYIDNYRRSLLHYAAGVGQEAMVEKLVSLGLDINATDDENETPLHWAAELNHPSVVSTIISLRGDIEARNFVNYTPLHIASLFANPSCVEVLLNAGANVGAVDQDGDTPLHSALNGDAFGHYRLYSDMLGNVEYVQGESPRYKTRVSRRVAVLALLLKAGADPNAMNWEGRTPLNTLVRKTEYLELLVKAGADPNKADKYGLTPLHRAASDSDLTYIRRLIELGASVAAVSLHGQTVLGHAHGNWRGDEIAEFLKAVLNKDVF